MHKILSYDSRYLNECLWGSLVVLHALSTCNREIYLQINFLCVINSCPPSPPLNKIFPSPQYLSETETYTCNSFQFLIYSLQGDKSQLLYMNAGQEEMPWAVPPRLSSPQLSMLTSPEVFVGSNSPSSPHSIHPNNGILCFLLVRTVLHFPHHASSLFLALTPHGTNPSRLRWLKLHVSLHTASFWPYTATVMLPGPLETLGLTLLCIPVAFFMVVSHRCITNLLSYTNRHQSVFFIHVSMAEIPASHAGLLATIVLMS